MSSENQPLSVEKFLSELNEAWGGNIYFDVVDQVKQDYPDLRQKASNALIEFTQQSNLSKGSIREVRLSGNIAKDFRINALAGMPHPQEAISREHLLADPFCRAFLCEQLEWFFRATTDPTPPDLVVINTLPFSLEGEDSVVFKTPFILPSLASYFDYAKTKASELGGLVNLTSGEMEKFEEEFVKGMDRFKQYVSLVESGKDEELHPIIRVVTNIAMAQYDFRPKGPSFLL